MSAPLRTVVDRELLARLGGMSIRARHLTEGTLTGQHRSPHQGSSVEFAQHREYVPGDEIRHIDWKAYAKSDKFHVKQFEDETNLRTYLLVDLSGSMDYGRPGHATKLEYAARLATALAYVLLSQGDAVGVLTFNEQLGAYLPPRARPDHFWNLVRLLEHAPAGGATSVVRALEYIAETAGRRSVVILLSDCFDFEAPGNETDQGGRLAALARQLRRHRHGVSVYQVLDPDELSFPFESLTLFCDLESDRRELADPRGMREQYLLEIRSFCDTLRLQLNGGDVRYRQVETGEPIEHVVFEMLSWRHK